MSNYSPSDNFGAGLWNQFYDYASSDRATPWGQWGAGTAASQYDYNYPIGVPQWGPSTKYNEIVEVLEAKWDQLPEEILGLILDKVFEAIDYVRIAAVCIEWYRLAKEKFSRNPERWTCRVRPPLLLLPPKASQSQSPDTMPTTRTMWSVTQNKVYDNVRLQLTQWTDITIRSATLHYGCGHGWLAKVDIDCIYSENPPTDTEWRVELFNPFREGTSITIPPVDTEFFEPIESSPKVILSADPTLNPNRFWILAFPFGGSKLAFYDSARGRWHTTLVRAASFTDAIFSKGQFYVFDKKSGILVLFDVAKARQSRITLGIDHGFAEHAYLVVSANGDHIFLVSRFVQFIAGHLYVHHEDWKVTTRFEVHELVLNNKSQEVRAVKVDRIRDEAFFVGDTPSVSVLASNFPNLMPNSIYYTNDSLNIVSKPDERHLKRVFSMNIFKLENNETIEIRGTHGLLPPVWITPPLPFDLVPSRFSRRRINGSNSAVSVSAKQGGVRKKAGGKFTSILFGCFRQNE